jgi:polysaccharide deacetylase family protein (PEP-CTERM system associated)
MWNILTIDVEDYFMVSGFADTISFDDWPHYESRVENNTMRLLDILDEYEVKATFFALGWIAEQNPGLIRRIRSYGHEIACHGYNHRLVYDLSHDEFRKDTRMAKASLEDAAGSAVVGYRATSYSVVKRSLWALDVLMEEGFLYDSSIYPIHHDRYGYPEFERFPTTIRNGEQAILEIPLSTVRLFGHNVPLASGGYFRLFPSWLTKWGIQKLNSNYKQPAIVCLHPWELDRGQPRLSGSLLSEFRHYINIGRTEAKLRQLLDHFSFRSVTDAFNLGQGDVQEDVASMKGTDR